MERLRKIEDSSVACRRFIEAGLLNGDAGMVVVARERMLALVGQCMANCFVVEVITELIITGRFSFGRDDKGNYIW